MKTQRKAGGVQMVMMFALVLVITVTAMARDLKMGMQGEDVRRWQAFLIARNFDLPANGKFGPATHRATTMFQKKWKLYVDGVVGKQTMRQAKQLGYDRIVSLGGGSASQQTGRLSENDSRTRRMRLQAARYVARLLDNPESMEILRFGHVIRNPDGTYAAGIVVRSTNSDGVSEGNAWLVVLRPNGSVKSARAYSAEDLEEMGR